MKASVILPSIVLSSAGETSVSVDLSGTYDLGMLKKEISTVATDEYLNINTQSRVLVKSFNVDFLGVPNDIVELSAIVTNIEQWPNYFSLWDCYEVGGVFNPLDASMASMRKVRFKGFGEYLNSGIVFEPLPVANITKRFLAVFGQGGTRQLKMKYNASILADLYKGKTITPRIMFDIDAIV